MPSPFNSRGFSLIELMITLVLGLIISGAIVQVLVSNQVTERLNRGLASAQESGRFIMTRLRNELIETGRYDPLDPNLERSVDVVPEAAFVQNHPIILPGDFPLVPGLGSVDGANGADDAIVAGMQGDRDCRGYKLGYADIEQFYVVNRYFVEDNKLKCVGFDGRVLSGQKVAVGNNADAAFTLLDDVYGFQVLYGIANSAISNDSSGRPVNYVTADNVAVQLLAGGQVVAVQIAVLIKGDSELYIDKVPTFKLLNEDAFSPNDHQLYKQFETTISFRNVKNFLRSNNQ